MKEFSWFVVEIAIAQIIASGLAALVWKSGKSDLVKTLVTFLLVIAYPLYYASQHHS